MRPGDFSPGNFAATKASGAPIRRASMRPGDFSPGNMEQGVFQVDWDHAAASMRPGDFSPGNLSAALAG